MAAQGSSAVDQNLQQVGSLAVAANAVGQDYFRDGRLGPALALGAPGPAAGFGLGLGPASTGRVSVARRLTSGHEIEEKLEDKTIEKVSSKFAELKELIAQKVNEKTGRRFTGEEIRVSINLHTGMATWYAAGEDPATAQKIFIGHDHPGTYRSMNELSHIVGGATVQRGDIKKVLGGGLTGSLSNDHMLSQIDFGHIPHTFDEYVMKTLPKHHRRSAVDAIAATKRISTAYTYRDAVIEAIRERIGEIKTLPEEQRDKRQLALLAKRLDMFEYARMDAVNEVLALQDSSVPISVTSGKEVAVKVKHPNPEFAKIVGALSVRDREAYSDYCEKEKLREGDQKAVEQLLIDCAYATEKGEDLPDIEGLLFADLGLKDFQDHLRETSATVTQHHTDMGGVDDTQPSKAAISQCVAIHKTPVVTQTASLFDASDVP